MDEFDTFDLEAAVANYSANVVHAQMGANGIFANIMIAGSNARLPGSECPADRNWRNISILPLTLLDFAGNSNGDLVTLTWQAVNESATLLYIIEKSTDGKTFTAIGTVQAQNNAAGNKYQFTDRTNRLVSRNAYYRLQQVNKAGAKVASSVLVFRIDGAGNQQMTVSPNPASNAVTVKITATRDVIADIRIVDLQGRVLIRQKSRLSSGINAIGVNSISSLPAGIYILQVLVNNSVSSQKLVIAR